MNPLTILGWIFYYPIYNILMVLYEAFAKVFHGGGAFALAIVVLTLAMRVALIPLTRKQLKSSREMQVLAPKLKALQAEHRGDPQAMMAAQRALYKEHGVSPASGCLPLIIQMPFIYALYGAFNTVLRGSSTTARLHHINSDLYPFVPHLSHIPNAQFLWVDLAKADPTHILPILAAILTFLQLRMAMPVRPKRQPGQPADPTSQATGMMQYVMPFVTLFIGLSFPAGLALYWCVTTLFSAVQQYFISGWGSLFVGVPGMEHMVPAPTQPGTPALAGRPGARPGATAASARALTPAAQEESAGGLRGLLRSARQQFAAAQQSATAEADRRMAERDAKKGASANGNGADSFAVTRAENGTGGNGSGSGAPTTRRQRPQRTGAVLVKPTTSAAPANELPEDAIAREATGLPEVAEPAIASAPDAKAPKAELPEVAISRLAGSNGGPSANQRRAGSGASSSANARPAVNTQRKNTNKGNQSARPRAGRPKGGR